MKSRTAAARYEFLTSDRTEPLAAARKATSLSLPYLLPPTPVIHTRVPGSLFHPLLAPELKDHFITVDEELMMKTLADMPK